MKIVIMSAMTEEIAPTIEHFTAQEIDVLNSQKVFKYQGKNEFLFLNSGIGKINAAITTTLVIEKYQPDVIISIGTAGGVAKGMKVSDFVVADKMAFWDVDVTAFNYELGQLPGMPKYIEVKGYQGLLKVVEKIDAIVHIGTIVTGDSFVCTDDKRNFITENFENVHAIEMESTSILMTAQKLETKCLALRTISDMANEKSDISFDEYLTKVSEKFKHLVEEIDASH